MDFLVYIFCFGVGLLFIIISAVFGHLFGHGDAGGHVGTGGHAEAGFEHTGMPGLSPFSPTIIACFVTAFGGAGMIFTRIKLTSAPFVSAPLAVCAGLGMAGGVFAFLSFVFEKTQSSSESRVGELKGYSATIITPIPPGGVGEIAYVQGGIRYTGPAREENGEAVPAGRTVTITRSGGTQFIVRAI